jgi:hypothetical protein
MANPKLPPTSPDEKALAYMSKVGEAVVEQIVAAKMNGRKVPALLFLPPPPRPSDRQLIGAFLPYFFSGQFAGEPFPELRFATNEAPDGLH